MFQDETDILEQLASNLDKPTNFIKNERIYILGS